MSFSLIFETLWEYQFLSRSRWALSNLPVRRRIDLLTSRPNWGPDQWVSDHSAKTSPTDDFFRAIYKKTFRTESIPTDDQTSLPKLVWQDDFLTRGSSAVNSVTFTRGSCRNSSDSETWISQIFLRFCHLNGLKIIISSKHISCTKIRSVYSLAYLW